MITNDMKRELNSFVDDFIVKVLRNNYAVVKDSIVRDFKRSTSVSTDEASDEEISDYIYDLLKTDTRTHFYGVGEVYNYHGRFEAIDDPIITSKAFDNPLDAKYEEK